MANEIINKDKYDISKVYRNIFGYIAPPYPGALFKRPDRIGGYEQDDFDLEKAKSFLNKSHYFPLAINFTENPRPKDYVFAVEPLVSISTSKNIKKTNLAGTGRRGTVKELISKSDYQITIQAILLGEDKDDLLDQLSALNEYLDEGQNLSIKQDVLGALGVSEIVIESASFPSAEGVEFAQGVSISAISDEPFEFSLTNNLL